MPKKRCPESKRTRQHHQPSRTFDHCFSAFRCEGADDTLFELQDWLGHTTPAATQHYATITPTKLAKSYADAGYFARNLHAIEVLVDQEAVRSRRAASEPWKVYDLGHGYCTYDFFEQCPHRMACAKCSCYLPKSSSEAQLVEGKSNLLRLRQEIPLSDEEMALSMMASGLWRGYFHNWQMSLCRPRAKLRSVRNEASMVLASDREGDRAKSALYS